MAISIKSDREIELMTIAGNIVYETHKYLKEYLKPGITTKELDTLAEDFIISKGAIPSCKGLKDILQHFVQALMKKSFMEYQVIEN